MADEYFRPQSNFTVAYTGTAGNIATACPSGVHFVRVAVTTDAHVAIGKTAIAVAGDMLMKALDPPEVFQIGEGERVSAIQDASGGDLWVTYLTHG